jgi:8-oxo-dGTP diphosphatase
LELPSDIANRLQPLNSQLTTEESAAVILLLVESENQILLVERKEQIGDPWSGQMAFPGGRFESKDKTLRNTVVREAKEEVGVNLEGRLIGRLEDLVPGNRPGLLVAPFVSLWYEKPKIQLSRDELENHFWIELDELHESYRPRIIPLLNREMLSYLCAGHIVWGLTARILQMFFELIRD